MLRASRAFSAIPRAFKIEALLPCTWFRQTYHPSDLEGHVIESHKDTPFQDATLTCRSFSCIQSAFIETPHQHLCSLPDYHRYRSFFHVRFAFLSEPAPCLPGSDKDYCDPGQRVSVEGEDRGAAASRHVRYGPRSLRRCSCRTNCKGPMINMEN